MPSAAGPPAVPPRRVRLRPPRPLRRVQPPDPRDLRLVHAPGPGPRPRRGLPRRDRRSPAVRVGGRDRRRRSAGASPRRWAWPHRSAWPPPSSWPSWPPKRPSRPPASPASSPAPASSWWRRATSWPFSIRSRSPSLWGVGPGDRGQAATALGWPRSATWPECRRRVLGGGASASPPGATCTTWPGVATSGRSSPAETSNRSATRRPTPTIAMTPPTCGGRWSAWPTRWRPGCGQPGWPGGP